MLEAKKHTLAVVIPSYKVTSHIKLVIDSIPSIVDRIYVVDDACPYGSGDYVARNCKDSRITIIKHNTNQGVGGAVISGYKSAIRDQADVIIKIDGDGQMDPKLIPYFVGPILNGEADYTKGNRFYELEHVRSMPWQRLMGNAILSFVNKLSSGYWGLFDPTNGYTAIHAKVADHLPFDKISRRYFFESDMLFRLNTLGAVVVDVPMEAKYGNEESNLKIHKIVGEFLLKHISNLFKRIIYNYYLRNLSIASFELPIGLSLILFGMTFGVYQWNKSANIGAATSAGTVMLAALPLLIGMQFLLAFLSYDISQMPKSPIHSKLFAKRYTELNIDEIINKS